MNQEIAACTALLAVLSQAAHDPEFIAQHRTRDTAFTRERQLTFPRLIALMLRGMTQSIQGELDAFFAALIGKDSWHRVVTKSAFSQARQKLSPTALSALNTLWTQANEQACAATRWCGLRVVASDSSTLRLPPWRENQEAFGQHCGATMARATGLLAVASGQMLVARLDPCACDERSALVPLLGSLSEHDMLVLDRGYPARWMFALLAVVGIPFCIRVDACGWADVKRFVRAGKLDAIVELPLCARDRANVARQGMCLLSSVRTVRVRLVRVILPNGRIEVLITSAYDPKQYPASAFGALYHSRWRIEECFKTLKHRLHLEAFSGELPHAITQDFHAKILLANIAHALCHAAHALLAEDQQDTWRVNHTHALRALKHVLGNWLCCGICSVAVHDIILLLNQTLEWYRPDRSCPRKHAVGGARKPRRAYKTA